MNILPFVREGLGNSSYLAQVGEGDAVLIDPDRSVDRYLKAAQERGWKIVSILETHLHADFVSGAREAAYVTGAELHAPEDSHLLFPYSPLKGGQRLESGGVRIEAIASPGHTPEHLSYLFLWDRQPPTLFSGGALIVGGAARTDLISPAMTEPLTRAEFRTLRNAFTSLDDETLLYPTHGGGSFCSVGSGGERVSTLGNERASNPLLAIEDEEEFVRWFPGTFPAGVPDYFFRMRPINQAGSRLRSQVARPAALSPEEFDAARRKALVIDVRPIEEYARAHIPGALNNTLRSGYATFLGWLVPPDATLLFVLGDMPLEQVVDESLLVGYERFGGWLEGGMEVWEARGLPVQRFEVVNASQARKAIRDGAAVLDVREDNEFESGHIEGAIHVPLGKLEQRIGEVPRDRPIVAYCGHGERSSTALSLLEQAGIRDALNLKGGFGAWKDAGFKSADE
ncbi:MAG: MBL fold metallo-hydrolase [Chloroflexi bacterium]|nr:MBL fold metallo-hydrolase [Chloroflexota bacterium]